MLNRDKEGVQEEYGEIMSVVKPKHQVSYRSLNPQTSAHMLKVHDGVV